MVAVELRNVYPLPEDTQVNRKVSLAAHHWLDLHRLDSSEALLEWARTRGMTTYGAGPRATISVDELPLDRPLLVLFGNEKRGLLPETAAACDGTFQIPMHGFAESFNVSVSVGMVLRALTTRIRARLAQEGRTGDLDPARRDALLARWCFADVRRSDAILRRKLGDPT